MTAHKKAARQGGPKESNQQRNYSILQIAIKALPWLVLHAAAIVVVSFSAGGLL